MIGREPVKRGAVELAAAAGISYRQLDYWTRHGWIRFEHNGAGSGTERRPTDAEWRATIDVARRLAELEAQTEEIRSGRYFAERLDLWREFGPYVEQLEQHVDTLAELTDTPRHFLRHE